MGRALRNRDTLKKTLIPGLIIVIFIYSYIGKDNLKGKYLLSESDYVQATGHITYSSIESRTDKYDRVSYYPIIQYQFYVGGKAYFSEKLHFSYTAQKYLKDAEAVIDKYPIDSQVKVYFEKDNPTFSVLEPNVHDKGAEVIFLLCIAFGFIVIYLFSWYEIKKERDVYYS